VQTTSGTTSMGRSIMAIALGYVVLVVCLGFTYLLGVALFPGAMPKLNANVSPPAPVLSVVAALCVCYGFLGSWVTVALARQAGIGHGLALSAMTLVLGLLKPILAPHQEPLWSHLILLAACLAGTIAGAYTFGAQRNPSVFTTWGP
jgi:hypothetical protein